MFHLDTSFLIRALVAGSPQDVALRGWLQSGLPIGASVIAWTEFLCGPLMGALSDRFGRRPILLISMIGLGLDYLLLAVAPSLWVVALARIVGGVMGASVATSSAYIADITPPERRAQNFGLIGVAFGIGFILGPLAGGVLGEFGSRIPFFGASAVSFVAFAFAWFLLPESLDAGHRHGGGRQ